MTARTRATYGLVALLRRYCLDTIAATVAVRLIRERADPHDLLKANRLTSDKDVIVQPGFLGAEERTWRYKIARLPRRLQIGFRYSPRSVGLVLDVAVKSQRLSSR